MNIKKICVLIVLSILSYIEFYGAISGLFVGYCFEMFIKKEEPRKIHLWFLIPIAIGLLHKLAII